MPDDRKLRLMAMAAQAQTRTRAAAAAAARVPVAASPLFMPGAPPAGGYDTTPPAPQAPRSALGEGVAAAEGAIGQIKAMTGMAGPPPEPFQPSYAGEDAGFGRNAAQYLGRTVGGLAPTIAAGAMTGGAGSFLARAAGPAAAMTAQGSTAASQRGASPGYALASGAAQGALAAVPVAGMLGRLGGNSVGPLALEAAGGAGANVLGAVGSELLARGGGAEPAPMNLAEQAALGAALPMAGAAARSLARPTRAPFTPPMVPEVSPLARVGEELLTGVRADVQDPQVLRADQPAAVGSTEPQIPPPGAAGELAAVPQAGQQPQPPAGQPGAASPGGRPVATRGEYRPEGFPPEPPAPRPRQTTLDDMPAGPLATRGVFMPEGTQPRTAGEYRPDGFPPAPDPSLLPVLPQEPTLAPPAPPTPAALLLEQRPAPLGGAEPPGPGPQDGAGQGDAAGLALAPAGGNRTAEAQARAAGAGRQGPPVDRAEKRLTRQPAPRPAVREEAARTTQELPREEPGPQGQGRQGQVQEEGRQEGLLSSPAASMIAETAGAARTDAAAPVLDRTHALGERIEARAKQRMAERARQMQQNRSRSGGRATGGTTLPGDVIDLGAILAARAIKAGATTAKAIREVVVDDLGLNEDTLKSVRRVAGRLVRGSLDKSGAIDHDRFERAVGHLYELDDAGRVSRRAIDRTTGVTQTPEQKALDRQMRRDVQTAGRAYREAYRTATAEGRQRLETMRADLKAKRATADGIRAEAVRLAQGLPIRVRGKLTRTLQTTDSLPKLSRALRVMTREIDAHTGSEDAVLIQRRTGARKLAKLDNDTRAVIDKHLTGLPELRKALLQKDAAAVRAAADQIRDKLNAITEVVHDYKRKNRVILAGKIEEASALREQLGKSIEKAKTPQFMARTLANTDKPKTPLIRRLIRSQLTNESVAMTIDGDFTGEGIAHKTLVRDMWAGESAMHGTVREFRDTLDQAAARNGMGSLGKAMQEASGSLGKASQKRIAVDLGSIRSITLGEAMSIYAMDPATKAKIYDGNEISFVSNLDRKVTITPKALDAIEAALTPAQKAMVSDTKRAIETQLQPKLFRALRRIKGWEPEKVVDYWPTSRNRNLKEGKVDDFNGWSGTVDRHLEDAGFTKNREGGKAPFIVDDFFRTALDHAQSSAAVIHMAEPIRTAEMVLLDPSLKERLNLKFGTDMTERLREAMREASNLGRYQTVDKPSQFMLALTRNTSRALTSLNYRSWLRQLGGVASMAPEMPAEAYRHGIAHAFDQGVAEEMVAHSPFLWNRYAEAPSAMLSGMGSRTPQSVSPASLGQTVKAAGRSVRSGRLIEAAGLTPKAMDAIKVSSFFDAIPARVAWAGFREMAKSRPELTTEAARLKWTAEQTENVIRRTQNTFSVLDSSKFAQMARKNPVLAPLAMFTGDSSKAFNNLYQAAGRGKADLAKVAAARAINAAWGATITAGAPLAVYSLASLISGNSHGREKQKDMAMQRLGDTFLRELAGTALFGDKAYDLAAGAVRGVQGQDPLETPSGGQLRQIVQGLGNLAAGAIAKADAADPAAVEKASSRFASGVQSLALGASTAVGLPLAPLAGDVKRIAGAAKATAVDDLLYERKKLTGIDKADRTPAQKRRLARLDAFHATYSSLKEAENALAKKGEHKRAAQIRQRLEDVAQRFADRSPTPDEVATR